MPVKMKSFHNLLSVLVSESTFCYECRVPLRLARFFVFEAEQPTENAQEFTAPLFEMNCS